MDRIEYFIKNRYTGASPELRKHIRDRLLSNEEVMTMTISLMDYLISLSIHNAYRDSNAVKTDVRNVESVVEDMYRRHDPIITHDTYIRLKETIDHMERTLSATEEGEQELMMQYVDEMVSNIYKYIVPDMMDTIRIE